MREYLPLIGFGGPILILVAFQLMFWRGVGRAWLRLLLVYIFSVTTGILSDVIWRIGGTPSAFIAGVGAPLVYCLLFTVLLATKRTDSTQEGTPESRRLATESKGWSPTVIAALIQAIATVIVAIIAKM
jgi:hypothetical protein